MAAKLPAGGELPGIRAHDGAATATTTTPSLDVIEIAGAIKWFDVAKGFGFIVPDDGGKDVFVHVSVLARAQLSHLAEGQTVSMQVVQTPKGREAVSLEPQD